MAEAQKLTLELRAITRQFQADIKKAQRSVSTFSQNIKRSLNDAASGAAKGFKNVVRTDSYQAAAVAATGLGFALKGAVSKAMNFEKSMQAVAAVSGATGQDFKSLGSLARELGRTTQFSASEAAGAMEMLAMAGLSTEQMLKATGPTLNLAAAGGIELAEAADIATNVMGGMSLKVGDLNMINDVLAKTSSSANTNVREMAEVFAKVGGVAPTMGASMQEVSGMAGILANNGIKAAEAGTALRNVMLRMAAEKEAQKGLAELGVSATDAQGNMRKFPDILRDMEERMTALGLSEAKRAEIQKRVFGLRATAAGSILQQAAANGELTKMIDKVTDSDGAAQDQAKKRQQGLAGSLKRLDSALEGLAIAFGGPLLTPIAMFAEALAAVASPITWLFEKVPALGIVVGGLTVAFVGLVAALPILAAIKGAILGLTGAATVIAGLKAIFTGLLLPISLLKAGFLKLAAGAVPALFSMAGAAWSLAAPFLPVIAAIAGVVAVVALLVKFWPQIKEAAVKALKATVKFVVKIAKKIFQAYVGLFEKIRAALVTAVKLYIDAWLALPRFIGGLVRRIVDFFMNIDLVQAGVNALMGLWEGFKSAWVNFANWLGQAFQDVIKGAAENLGLGWIFPGGEGQAPQRPIDGATEGSAALRSHYGMHHRRLGGPVSAGRPYMVGEAGPELFIPGSAGEILSNRNTMNALTMSPSVTINVAGSNASPEEIAAAVNQGIENALMEAEAGVRALLND